MIPLQLLLLGIGTALIRGLHDLRRRLAGEGNYFSFSDFLVEESRVHARGFFYMAVAPFVGGALLGLLPVVDPSTAAAAGFLAAYIGVWPVFRFRYQLLDEYLLPYWDKLKFLYVIFVGFSTSVAYLGLVTVRATVPLLEQAVGTAAWAAFVDSLAANALYDLFRSAVVAAFIAGGVYVNRQRSKIGEQIGRKKEMEWEQEMERYRHRDNDETLEGEASRERRSEDIG